MIVNMQRTTPAFHRIIIGKIKENQHGSHTHEKKTIVDLEKQIISNKGEDCYSSEESI